MRDGLYWVTYGSICAGFIVRNGRVRKIDCAPVLRRRLAFWVTIAVWVCE